MTLSDTLAPSSESYRLERALAPYYGLHNVWWARALAKHGKRPMWEATTIQNYYQMTTVTKLLRFAGEQVTDAQSHLAQFKRWCTEHADEEAGEDEWMLNDLEVLGHPRDEIREGHIATEVLELVGAQFSLAAMMHPASVLGYCFVVEVHHSSPEALARTQEELGLPDEALHTLAHHVEADPEHAEPILAFLDILCHEERCRSAVERSAILTLTGWTRYYERMAQAAEPWPA